MDSCSQLKDESTSAKELQLETTDMDKEQGERRIHDPFRVMYRLWHEITFAERFYLETEIRAAKQEGRSIKELFYVMRRSWVRMEPMALMKSSSFRKFQEENRLVQFLLALRDEFEPFKRSLLSRSPVPSLQEVISELKDEEARLRSLSGYLETESKTTEVEDDSEPESVELSCPGGTLSNVAQPAVASPAVAEEYDHSCSGGTLSNVAQSAAASPAVAEVYDHSCSGGTHSSVAQSAAASPAVAEVSDHLGSSEESYSGTDSSTIKILTYNVCIWDVELHERTKALCGLIQLHTPDIICFQEVTLDSYNIFRQSSWWNGYECSLSLEEATEEARIWSYFCMQLSKLPVKSFSMWPFRISRMGRQLCVADIQVCRGKSLIVATSHLESPDVFRDMRSKERVAQAKQSVNCLHQSFQNVIFCVDTNWDDEREGRFPLPEGWIDAWQKLRPWLKGWTCDTKSNPMLAVNKPLRMRGDRFLCKLSDFKLVKINMIGTDAIPGVSYTKTKRWGSSMQTFKLPVLPSDHYGLLLEIQGN